MSDDAQLRVGCRYVVDEPGGSLSMLRLLGIHDGRAVGADVTGTVRTVPLEWLGRQVPDVVPRPAPPPPPPPPPPKEREPLSVPEVAQLLIAAMALTAATEREVLPVGVELHRVLHRLHTHRALPEGVRLRFARDEEDIVCAELPAIISSARRMRLVVVADEQVEIATDATRAQKLLAKLEVPEPVAIDLGLAIRHALPPELQPTLTAQRFALVREELEQERSNPRRRRGRP